MDKNKKYNFSWNDRNSFTLTDVIMAVAILSIIIVASLVFINPGEHFAEARDVKRQSDIGFLNTIIGEYKYGGGRVGFLGNKNVVYVSLPDTSKTCSNLALPELQYGWTYNCVQKASLLKTDGSGWVPINFDSANIHTGPLPVDPVNSAQNGFYYTYTTDGIGEDAVSSVNFESNKYSIAGDKDYTSTDSGSDDYAYESGNNNPDLVYGSNIILDTNINHLVGSYSPGWDESLNGTYKPEYGFSSGYSDSVPSPSVGYHAHVSTTEGLGGSGCFELVDKNCQFGFCERELSFSQSWNNPATLFGWTDGTTIKVKFVTRSDTKNKKIRFGILHWSNSASDYVLSEKTVKIDMPKHKTWEIVKENFVVDGDWEMNSHNATLIFYGNQAPEGVVWIDNVQVEYVNP